MEAFWVPLFGVFLAELGDKTQLVAMSLAARFNTRVVLAGILTATLLVHILSVAIGGLMGKMMPQQWINLVAGLAFIGFGFWTLRGDELDGEEDSKCKGTSAFWIVTCTFFLAELGDKTMLTTVAFATDPKYNIYLVWIGSSLGMVVSDGLAILVGKILGARLPERAIKIGASVIFFGFGIVKAVSGAHDLPAYGWGIALGVTLLFATLYLRGAMKPKEPKPSVESAGVFVEDAYEEETVTEGMRNEV